MFHLFSRLVIHVLALRLPATTEAAVDRNEAAADLATLACAAQYGLHALTVRPNNHTGPGQSERFVVPGLVAQARAQIRVARRA